MAKPTLPRSGVYVIREIATGRCYVGSSRNINERWHGHRHEFRHGTNHGRREMQDIWSAQGSAAFEFETLELVHDAEQLKFREQYWIDFFQSYRPEHGFNLHPSAHSPKGFLASPETKKKFSEMRKGRKLPPRTPEHRAALSRAKLGTKASDETKAKQSAARLGRSLPPRSASHRAAISAAKLGTKASAETRAKLSAGRKGRKLGPQSDAHKEALRQAAIGRKHSPEARAKMSAYRKGRPLQRKAKTSITINNMTPMPPDGPQP